MGYSQVSSYLRTHLWGKFKVLKCIINRVNVKMKKQCLMTSASLCKETCHIGMKIESIDMIFQTMGTCLVSVTLDSEKKYWKLTTALMRPNA